MKNEKESFSKQYLKFLEAKMRTLLTVLMISLFCFSMVWAEQTVTDDLIGEVGPVQIKLDPNYRPHSNFTEAILYDNGPLVNGPGMGFGGADASLFANRLNHDYPWFR